MLWLKTVSAHNLKCASAYLKQHIETSGISCHRGPNPPAKFDTVVTYGTSYDGPKPNLNGQCNRFNKRTHLKKFVDAGLNAPLPMTDVNKVVRGKTYLARNVSHRKGLDIIECHTPQELANAMHQREFFVEWIPTATEYRAWVINEETLAIYEKQYKGQGEYQGVARNRRFGFKFVSMDMRKLPGAREIGTLAQKAVEVINLNWGAVDIIKGKDGKFYVLEVNTAPAIDSPDRKSGQQLGRAIAEWANAQ